MLLMARRGVSAPEIGRRLGCSDRCVRKWKARFAAEQTLGCLDDRPRAGRPARIALHVRCELVRIACERIDEKRTKFRDVWSYGALADELKRRTGVQISISEVGRILRFAELRPHNVKQWLHSPDPAFSAKAKKICQLYLNPPNDGVVLCIDEKPLQALQRLHPTHLSPTDASVRFEFEYKRHGTQSLLAAFDISDGNVVASVVPHRSADALLDFLKQVAREHPRGRIYVVWDNLNIHYDGRDKRWTRFNRQHGGRFRFIYTPKHASWMNQVEIWFSILHRRILRYGSFASLKDQRAQVLKFIRHWNGHEKHPFRWTWRCDSRQNPKRQARAA